LNLNDQKSSYTILPQPVPNEENTEELDTFDKREPARDLSQSSPRTPMVTANIQRQSSFYNEEKKE